MRRVLLDTNVLLYSRGGPHPYRQPSIDVLTAGQDGRLLLEASFELLQELGHVLLRRGADGAAVADNLLTVRRFVLVHPCDEDLLDQMQALLAAGQLGDMRDAIHAATAFAHGLTEIVSADQGFDEIDGLTRIDPIELAAELAG